MNLEEYLIFNIFLLKALKGKLGNYIYYLNKYSIDSKYEAWKNEKKKYKKKKNYFR